MSQKSGKVWTNGINDSNGIGVYFEHIYGNVFWEISNGRITWKLSPRYTKGGSIVYPKAFGNVDYLYHRNVSLTITSPNGDSIESNKIKWSNQSRATAGTGYATNYYIDSLIANQRPYEPTIITPARSGIYTVKVTHYREGTSDQGSATKTINIQAFPTSYVNVNGEAKELIEGYINIAGEAVPIDDLRFNVP